MGPQNSTGCMLIERFSLKEKLLMRTGWLGFTAVGVYSIYRHDPLWAFLYIAWGGLGFALVILPFLCAHCPYPYKLSTCLFMPPQLVRLYAYRGPRISTGKKIASGVVFASLIIIPQIWLVRDIPLLVLFWIIGVPALGVFPLYYCHRCRHHGCPMNKANN